MEHSGRACIATREPKNGRTDEPVLGSAESTDAEKVAAFDSFIANSGTYELTDSTLTTRPMVAKNPTFMAGGSLTFTYQIEGDDLRLTLRL
jgi:hypothetical protein